jgi:hypothetical protein
VGGWLVSTTFMLLSAGRPTGKFSVITSMTAAELNRVVGGGIRDVLSQYLNGCYY